MGLLSLLVSAYLRNKSIDDNMGAFSALIDKAGQEGGYDHPKEFLRSLSEEDLSVLQTLHNLGKPINPAAIGMEGSLNLLMPPTAAIDLNHDGTVEMGAMKRMFTFPPNQASQGSIAMMKAFLDKLKASAA